MFKIAKRIFKTNQDVLGDHCIRKDDDAFPVYEEHKKIAWKDITRRF